MAEPIGGREHRWTKADFFRLAELLQLCAIILGWMVLIILPVCVADMLWDFAKALQADGSILAKLRAGGNWKQEALPLLKLMGISVGLAFCVIWAALCLLCAIAIACIRWKRWKMERPRKTSADLAGPESVKMEKDNTEQEKAQSASAQGVSQESKSPEQEKRESAERERREKREKIAQAKKAFADKVSEFKSSLPKSYEVKAAGGVVDFSEKFKVPGLSVVMKDVGLRPYLTWDAEAMTLRVNDARAFFKDKKARFSVEVSDPLVSADPDLKDEIVSVPLEVVLEAAYPSVVQKFFDWAAKVPVAARLENAKQGQEVDYDIRSLLSYDPEWAVWARADGLGSLKADFDNHRIKGEPTVGTDARIRVVFSCKGYDDVTHELDLLLTCNMDAEQRWKQIERDESDKPAVLSDDDRLMLSKMADAVRSTGNAYEVRKPDDTFSKPHRVSRRQRSGEYDLAYASIRGRSHIRTGSFREDDVDARFFLDGKGVAIVVSDGAGSAPLSRRGSTVVTSVGMRCLIDLGEKLVASPVSLEDRSLDALSGFAETVRAIQKQIEFEADNIKDQKPDFLPKEMYATFLAALVLPVGDRQILLTYSAGDGAIGLACAGQATGIKCVPDHGQSAGQTLFVLNKGADDAERRLTFTQLPESYALLLMSDGVSDPRIAPEDEAKPETWDKLAEELKPLVREEPLNHESERREEYANRGKLCEWLDSYEKGHHDDRTIAVLFHKLS